MTSRPSRARLPPGPRLPAAVQSLLALTATEAYTDHCLRRFGTVCTLRILGLGTFVSFSEPDAIRQLFRGDREVFRGGEANARLGTLARDSVVVADGEQHLRLRRLVAPPFHGAAIAAHRDLIERITRTEIASWPVGEPFPILERMRAITLEVILQAVIGTRDDERAQAFRRALPGVLSTSLMTLFAEARHPRLFGSRLGRRLPFMAARERVYALVEEEIAAHRAESEPRTDVLSVLMHTADPEGRPLTEVELRDQVVTLLMAGHETTATALAWVFERLVRHPDVMAQVREALAAGTADELLDAVIHETLRVRPPIDQVMRRLAAPVELGGHVLPAGTLVAASILGVQRSEVWPEATRFDPRRLLGVRPPAHALIPFGGGVRRCVGASFALAEMQAILATVLGRVEFEVCRERDERPVRWRQFTTVPGRGARVRLAARPADH